MPGPALEPAPKLFAQQLVCSMFNYIIPMLILNCFGGLPAAAVGPPVLFLAPTLLLVQALACYNS